MHKGRLSNIIGCQSLVPIINWLIGFIISTIIIIVIVIVSFFSFFFYIKMFSVLGFITYSDDNQVIQISWPLWHWVHPTSLPPSLKNGNYCIVNQAVWSWDFDKQQACHMQWANYLGLLSKSSNKWNPHPIMRVLCVNDSPFLFFAQTFQGFKSTLNFVERVAWWLFTYAPLMIVVVNVNGNGTAQPSIYLVVILE